MLNKLYIFAGSLLAITLIISLLLVRLSIVTHERDRAWRDISLQNSAILQWKNTANEQQLKLTRYEHLSKASENRYKDYVFKILNNEVPDDCNIGRLYGIHKAKELIAL